ncbi:hypothetical protein EVAR_46153_1 [Eumeta japonica]|uniref:Reverse transcriptase domain-containing protein n=1 Tax=Eumeta variegata TaxID=151549 RepID=A0A4C2ABK4_EUMVA|nr:hypothetical protein EVAR_46153_1 [Eumeta japonica]
MFMQIKIKPEDRDALRYLWRGDKRGNEKPTEYRMTSLIFGATSSPATSIYIKNFNAEKYRETEPEVHRAVIKNHYVDDYIQSFETEQKAIDIAQRVRDVHREARFELKQWTSNSKRLLTALNETSEQKKSIDLHTENSSERVLGLNWNSDRDELTFNLNLARLPHDIMNSERPTKRQVLKIVMSLFDPLGLASPVTTKAKQLLQEIWRRGTGWDDEIDQDLATQWNDWKSQLINLKMKNTALLSKIYRRHHITATHICGCQRDGLRSSPLLASDRLSRSRFDITDNSQIESGAAQNHVDTETRTPGGRHGNQNGDHCYRGARQKTERQILLDGQQDRAHMVKERRSLIQTIRSSSHRRHRRK